MSDVNNFIEAMLKSAKEKKETKAQTRYEDVDQEKVTEITEELLGFKKKKKEDS